MSVRLCCETVIGLCYILCILQHFVYGGGGVFFPDMVYEYSCTHMATVGVKGLNKHINRHLTSSPSLQRAPTAIQQTNYWILNYISLKCLEKCHNFSVTLPLFFACALATLLNITYLLAMTRRTIR